MRVLSWLQEIGVTSFFDIAIIALLIYSLLVWLKRTKRSASVLAGIMILAGVYLAAKWFNLALTAAILQGFFAVSAIALIVVFQEELRYFFEQIAHWSMERKITLQKPKQVRLPRREVEILARTLTSLASERVGALVVVRGKDLLLRHLEGGVDLEGLISEPILRSIFDPHSIGHDGAVVVEGDRIAKLGCHLPLSKKLEKVPGGTRHAAAVGLSERTDAVCLVVSEERGTVSVARHGEIRTVESVERLTEILEDFYQEVVPRPESSLWQDLLKRNSREKLLAIALALALWFVLVHESETVWQTYDVPVKTVQLPSGLTIVETSPTRVQVTLSGPHKAFYFFNREDIHLELKLWDASVGRRPIPISTVDVKTPEGFNCENVQPSEVVVDVQADTARPVQP